MDELQTQMKKLVEDVEQSITHFNAEAERLVKPYRVSAFQRFPFLFSFLVTIGASALLYGMEKFYASIASLEEHPLVFIMLGIVILALTGRLYKKLS